MTTKQEMTPKMARLIDTFYGSGGFLALKCFLLIADKPRTITELCELTGSANSRVNVAVRTMTPWYCPRQEAVIRPKRHLINRQRRGSSGHRLSLTTAGRKLLQE